MIASEKKIGKFAYSNGYPSSKTLRDSADDVIKTKKQLRHERIQNNKNIHYLAKLEEQLKEKKKLHKHNQKDSAKLWEDDLNSLATKRAKQWNIKALQAIIVIKAAEESRKLHKKQRAFLKPKQNEGNQQILVPTPETNHIPNSKEIVNPKIQCTVEDPKEIFNILLRQNYRH